MRLLPLVGLAFATTAHAQTLEITTTRPATCTRKTTNGDVVSMQYRGSLQADGSVFDSSYGRNAPFSFTLGSGQVIAGWDQGLLGMCIGEARKLVIPPALAYGQEGVGPIPPGATLIFETELVAIQGVEPEPQDGDKKPTPKPKPESKPSPTQPTTPPQTQYTKPTADPLSTATAPIASAAAVGSPKDGEDKGECNLLGDFALLVQGALGLLAVSSLAVKRMREHPRRPLKIWFFDVSKQVFGSVLLHLANILMSMLSSGQFDVVSEVVSETASTNSAVPAGAINEDAQPNPCSFYLLNLAIDTTIGIPVLVLLLKLLHRAFLLTPLASPPESIRSGNYGHPPRATWWLKQSIIYFLGLIGMKLCVLALFTFLPWIAWVGDWALRWTEGNTALQIAFVMFVFPLVMNALQYWIIDGFIKERSTTDSATSADRESQGEYHVANTSDDEDDDEDEWQDRTARRQPLKEANPTVVPSREEYDPDVDGVGRPGKSRRE